MAASAFFQASLIKYPRYFFECFSCEDGTRDHFEKSATTVPLFKNIIKRGIFDRFSTQRNFYVENVEHFLRKNSILAKSRGEMKALKTSQFLSMSIQTCTAKITLKTSHLWYIWVLPKIGVPPNHPFQYIRFFIINHPFWGYSIPLFLVQHP